MIPDLENQRDYPSAYYFNPVHFDDRCFGYAVLKYENTACIPSVDYRDWLYFICNSFECIRRQLYIQLMYIKLEKSALTDGLTGLYNRNAFNIHVEEIMKSIKDKPTHSLFIMGDLNFLKKINDQFGHLAGDEALCTIGAAIKNSCTTKEKCYRFGGDEFIIIGIAEYTQEQIDNISESINEYLDNYNTISNNPFKVTVSLGAVYTEINSFSKIDDIIRTADQIMYENKHKTNCVLCLFWNNFHNVLKTFISSIS